MRDMSKAKRQPKGIPAGGEFAGGAGRAEALDLVDDTVADGLDRVDESDPAAVVGYLESLDPGVRFFLSDTARDLEARTIEDRDWCVAHAEELVRAAGAGDVSTVSLDGVARYWRPDDPEAADRLAAVAPDESAWRGYLCRTRAVSDGLFRERGPVAPATLLDNPRLTDRQRRALTVPLPDNPFTPAPDARSSWTRTTSTGATRWAATTRPSAPSRSWSGWSGRTRRPRCRGSSAHCWARPPIGGTHKTACGVNATTRAFCLLDSRPGAGDAKVGERVHLWPAVTRPAPQNLLAG